MTGTMWRVTAALATMMLAVVFLTASVGWRVYEAELAKPKIVAQKPVAQLVPQFSPELRNLPDPSKDGAKGTGLAGQFFLLAADGSYTFPPGDLYVMCEPISSDEEEGKNLMTEVWQFDPVALRKLRTSDERFGECYALFLPWPPKWEKVTQVKVSTQFRSKDEKQPTLSAPPQTIIVQMPVKPDDEK